VRHTGELVRGGIADAIARSLDRVHLHFGQFSQDFRHTRKLWPVVLDVLPRAEVGIIAVILARDHRQRAQLLARKQAVGNRDPQHRRMTLHIEPVLQAQGAELIFGQFASQIAASLIAKLGNALVDDLLVILVVTVHRLRHPLI